MLRQAGVSGHAHPVRGVHQPGLIIHPRRCSLDSGDFFNSRLGEGKFLQELSPSLPLFFLDVRSALTTWREGRKGKAPSHSWFGWNLIWRAALGSSHSCSCHQSQDNRAQLCLRAAVILCNLRLCRVTPCFVWQLYDWNSFKTCFEGVKRRERSAFVSHRSVGNTDT